MPLYTDMNSTTSNAFDASAINNAIKNILSTRIGSMPGKPTFGSNLHSIIFEPIDHITTNIIKNLVQEALYEWESRILVNGVTVSEVPEFNKVVASIDYNYRDKGLNTNEQISVAFTK